MLRVGERFERYLVEAVVGRGGMGEVYRAFDTRLNRRVALKILHPDAGSSAEAFEEAKARMLREARAAAALDHPNVVAIFDLGEAGGVPYIAMELLRGETLRTRMDDAEVTWALKLRWLVDVAHALEAAHDVGLVHRDIKPENVIVRDDGRIKVLDFGIARRVRMGVDPEGQTTPQGGALETITGRGVLIGSLHYMSPEQLKNATLDARSDQFSWAVMGYELLAGELPWPTRSDDVSLLVDILTHEPAPLRERLPELPTIVDDVIARAMAKSPDARFESLRDAIVALEPIAAAPSIRPPPRASSSAPPPPERAAELANVSFDTAPMPPGSVPEVATPVRTQPMRSESTTARPLSVSPEQQAPGLRSRTLVLAALGLALAAAFALGRMRSGPATAGPHGPTSAASAAVALPFVTVLDLPKPTSPSVPAVAAYTAALQAYRDGDVTATAKSLEDAISLDPSLGEAHLRWAILTFPDSITKCREHYQKATQARASMNARDQALLDAYEPAIQRAQADWTETERRLEAIRATHPGDIDVLFLIGRTTFLNGDFAKAREALDAAVAGDPKFAFAWASKGALEMGRDNAAAEAAYGKCLEGAPNATRCLLKRMSLQSFTGQCEANERDARRFIAIDPSGPLGYAELADASLALGKTGTVEEALKQSWAHTTDVDPRWQELSDRFGLEVVAGDFAAAERRVRELARAAEPLSERFYHTVAAWSQVRLYGELGQPARAAAVADDYEKREDGWTADPGVDEFSIATDMTPTMLAALYRGGRIDRATFRERRAAWVHGWEPRLLSSLKSHLWIHGFALTVETEDDAKDALEALPAFAPLEPFRTVVLPDLFIGRTFLLAGRLDEAMPALRRAAGWCHVLQDDPIAWVQAHYWYGRGLEASGDKGAACTEYGKVLARWGRPGAASVTAAQARARSSALGCKP